MIFLASPFSPLIFKDTGMRSHKECCEEIFDFLVQQEQRCIKVKKIVTTAIKELSENHRIIIGLPDIIGEVWTHIESKQINLLCHVMGDYECTYFDWIADALLDIDTEKKSPFPIEFTDDFGNKVSLKTFSDLYDYLMPLIEEKLGS